MSEICFIQTADAFHYKTMLEATSRTAVEFCRRHGYRYESFVGVKRGSHPWQATFNRIPMLKELLERRFSGWVVYLDADAFVLDLDFDLGRYLADKSDRSAVMVNMGHDPQWAVNAGVIFVNLGHPLGRAIVEGWNEKFSKLSDDDLAALSEWRDELSDQSMLFEVLNDSAPIRESIYYESPDFMSRDYSRFIRQTLRAYYPDFVSREAAVKAVTSEVLGGLEADRVREVHPIMVQALYRVVLGRDPDTEGLAGFTRHFADVGIEKGMRDTLAVMLESPEYLSRRRVAP